MVAYSLRRLHDLIERDRGTDGGLDALDRNAEILERLLDAQTLTKPLDKRIKGKHDIYFVFGNGKFLFDEWKFTK